MDDILKNKKTKKINKDLKHETVYSLNESHIYLNINYLDKYFINRTFVNNSVGKEQLEQAKQEFNTVKKIKDYLGV